MDAVDLDEKGLFNNAMRTWTGRRVDPLTMTYDEVDIRDIAHALARQCRYNGHTFGHLSVARHSLWVSDVLIDRYRDDGWIGFAGLLHDAAEAYTGDLIRPLKNHPRLGAAFAEIEEHVEAAVCERFKLTYPMPPEIHEADSFVLTHHELANERARYTWDSTYQEEEAAFMHQFVALGGGWRIKP